MKLSAEQRTQPPRTRKGGPSDRLRTAWQICRTSGSPALLFDGPDYGVHVNDAFRSFLLDGAGGAGQPGGVFWRAAWAAMRAPLDRLCAGAVPDGTLTLRVEAPDLLRLPATLRCTPVIDNGVVAGVFAFASFAEGDGAIRDGAGDTAQANAANAAKARFLAAASHDLRQPFQAMRLFLGVLDRQVQEASARETVRRLDDALEAGERLLNALLDISIIDSGQVAPKLEEVALDTLLQRLVEEFRPQAADKGLELKARLYSGRCRTDPVLLERIVRNLLSNAIRYTRTGGVLVAMRRRGDGVAVEVWDTGFGIPEDQAASIFEEFHQLENPERDRGRGFGLGLAIVQRLATMLEAPVAVRSRVGRGSMFRVTVPALVATAPCERAAPPAPRADGLDGTTMLVVDDDEMVLFGLRMMLESWGCTVVPAADLREVIAGLDGLATAPDMILTDLRLPGGANGFDVIQRVRKLYRSEVPAVVLTGEASQSPLTDGGPAVCWMVRKPVQPDELRAVLNSALSKG